MPVPHKNLVFKGFSYDLFVTRNMSFWHQCLSDAGIYAHVRDFGIRSFVEQLAIVEGGTRVSVFQREVDFTIEGKRILRGALYRPGIVAIGRKYRVYARKLLAALRACDADLTPAHWTAFTREYSRFCAGLQITAIIGRVGTKELRTKLRERGFNVVEAPRAISTMTYPKKHTPLFESRRQLLRIGAAVQAGMMRKTAVGAQFQKWLHAYRHIPVNFCEEPWLLADAKHQLAAVMEKDCRAELRSLKNEHGERVRAAEALRATIRDATARRLAEVLAEATYLNEFRKGVFSKVSLEYRSVFTRIAKRSGKRSWRDCFYLTPDEMLRILEGERIDIPARKRERQLVGMRAKHGEFAFLDEKTTKRFAEYVQNLRGEDASPWQDSNTTLRGFGASGGVVRGIAKVVYSSKDFHKAARGDILVAPHTSVDYIPVMEKAAAFVTNEGGITSHASIVSREMGKPCIIGTKIATRVLKDMEI